VDGDAELGVEPEVSGEVEDIVPPAQQRRGES
jgi:hypothetical protein